MAKIEVGKKQVEHVHTSLKVMAIMAIVLEMEYFTELVDTHFKNPQVNQFNGRVIKDIASIRHHLKNFHPANIDLTDADFVDEFAGEIHRVIHYFIHLPLSQIKQVMDNLDAVTVIEN